MDPSYESSDDEAEAMASQMGFSSFGTQGPPKKRKFNPKTDAMVEGQELESIDRGGKSGKGSGGNMIPLGKPRVFGVAPATNEDEIGLDEDEEDDERPAYVDTSLPPPIEQGNSDSDEGPAYIDTNLPPPDEEARAAQQRIDAILAGNTVLPVPPDSKKKSTAQAPGAGRGIGQFMSALQSASGQLATNSPASTADLGLPPLGQSRRELGRRNEFWYIGYYDPSFNENPWANLEKAKGLKPRGTWVERRAHGLTDPKF